MDDVFLRYYDGEMRYLREAAKEFASQFPEQARGLGLDGGPAPRDESVERLFQGFAFLMARHRQKLDDSLPEMTEPLLSDLQPIVTRALPSMAMVEFSPDLTARVREEVIPAETVLLTSPMEGSGLRCPYRTTEALTLRPLTLERVEGMTQPDGYYALILRFAASPLADLNQMDLRHLPLYLNGDPAVQSALYLALSQQVRRLAVRFPHSDNVDLQPFDGTLQPLWTQHWQSLWPQSDGRTLCGEMRPLLEYFTCPARYYRMQLNGLEHLRFPADTSTFELTITLDTPWPRELPLPETAIRLHCVPVINLFALAAEPLDMQLAQTEYRLRPHRLRDRRSEIYSVDVVSSDAEQQQRYIPFTHFRHKGGMLKYADSWPQRYFHTRMQRGPDGLNATWLILGGDDWQGAPQRPRSRLYLDLTCTNGNTPRRALEKALFDGDMALGTSTVHCHTRLAPTMPGYPPDTEHYQWQVLALLHPYAIDNIASVEALRQALGLFDWTHTEHNQRKLHAIQAVEHHPAGYPGQGDFKQGLRIHLHLDETAFSGLGDAWLFCELLDQFYAQYADVRRFTQLSVTLTVSNTSWQWPEVHRQRLLY